MLLLARRRRLSLLGVTGIARLGAGPTARFLNLVPVFAMLVGAHPTLA